MQPPVDFGSVVSVSLDHVALTTALEAIWARLDDAENTANAAAARVAALERENGVLRNRLDELEPALAGLKGIDGRLNDLESGLHAVEQATAGAPSADRIAELEDALRACASRDALADLAREVHGNMVKIGDNSKDINSLQDALTALGGGRGGLSDSDAEEIRAACADLENKLADLQSQLDALNDRPDDHEQVEINTKAIALLNDKVDNLSLDSLVENKAASEHRAIVEDDDTIHDYESGQVTTDTVEHRVAATSVSRAAGATVTRVEVDKGPHSAVLNELAGHRNMHEAHNRALRHLENKHDDVLLSYNNMNSLVAEHAELLEALQEQVDELAKRVTRLEGGGLSSGDGPDKADLAYVNECMAEFEDKLRQLVDVTNGNVEVLGSMLNGKAEAGDLAALRRMIAALRSEDGLSMAAGKIHFRCLSCDRWMPQLAGPSTPSFVMSSSMLAADELGAAGSSQRMFSVGDETVLFGRDAKIYRGRAERAAMRPFSAPPLASWERVQGPAGASPQPPRTSPTYSNGGTPNGRPRSRAQRILYGPNVSEIVLPPGQ